jgi:hypothetical protein
MTTVSQTNLAPQIIDFIRGDSDDKFAHYQRMANIIIDLMRKTGGCLPQDLFPLGFSEKETVERWHMAYAMANIELKLMNSTDMTSNIREVRYT